MQTEREKESQETDRKNTELVDMMEKRKVDLLCDQENRWKESKNYRMGAGSNCFIMEWMERETEQQRWKDPNRECLYAGEGWDGGDSPILAGT